MGEEAAYCWRLTAGESVRSYKEDLPAGPLRGKMVVRHKEERPVGVRAHTVILGGGKQEGQVSTASLSYRGSLRPSSKL